MKRKPGFDLKKLLRHTAAFAGLSCGLLFAAHSTSFTFYPGNSPEDMRFDESKNPYSYNLLEIVKFKSHNPSESTRIHSLIQGAMFDSTSGSALITGKTIPWSAYWYPVNEGGMLRAPRGGANKEYADMDSQNFPDVVQLKNWADSGHAEDMINRLPAPLKLDILMGNVFKFVNGQPNAKFYEISRKEQSRYDGHKDSYKTNKRGILGGIIGGRGDKVYRPRDWFSFGNCLGWAIAATREPDPRSYQVRKEIVIDGRTIQLDFTLSQDDVALFYMMAYTTFVQEEADEKGNLKDGLYRHAQIGRECYKTAAQRSKLLRKKSPSQLAADEEESACDDVNAGSFFVTVTNKIGKYGRAIFGDIQADIGNWNHPFVGYSMDVGSSTLSPHADSAPGTHHRRKVDFSLVYRDWSPPGTASSSAQFEVKNYEFYLDLDTQENVLGGDWISFDHPDYIADVRKMGFARHPVKVLKYIEAMSGGSSNHVVTIPADLRSIGAWSSR
ncbi:MAG: hypothetical protein EOP09_07585 [Proteobacteria bacterium]|nr:MAG: hypothetical protein EOP09_07585 [Pseudomonadota bacterium]